MIDVVDPVGDTLVVGPVGGTPMMDVVGPEFDSLELLTSDAAPNDFIKVVALWRSVASLYR